MPRAEKFVDRPDEMAELERTLLPGKQPNSQQNIFVLRDLGGIGKTQLAAKFARRYQSKFSSVFWLNGDSQDSLKRSIASCASRVPAGQISERSRTYSSGDAGDINATVKEMMDWLEQPENTMWLLVFDNVDRDFNTQTADPKAYDISRYIPGSDHGSVLITTWLARLQQLGSSYHLGKVNRTQGREILNSWCPGKHGKICSYSDMERDSC